jgi:hypothetical protein
MKLFVWGVVIVALGYVAYSGMISMWSWWAVATAIDEVVTKESNEAVPTPPRELKAKVMTATNEAGVPLEERDVIVTREDRTTRIEVIWTIPVVVFKGESVVAVPLSVKRTVERR